MCFEGVPLQVSCIKNAALLQHSWHRIGINDQKCHHWRVPARVLLVMASLWSEAILWCTFLVWIYRTGREGSLPALTGTPAASVQRDSPFQLAQSVVWVLGAWEKQPCSVSKQGSFGGPRPLSGSDPPWRASSCSLHQRGKGEGAQPTRSQQGSVCPDGCISWCARTAGVLQWSAEVREVKEEALCFKRL